MRLVWRQLPLTDLHPHALAAAGFAEAAQRQGRFWALHDVLFPHQRALDVDDLHAHAAAVGLDPGAWRRTSRTARACGAGSRTTSRARGPAARRGPRRSSSTASCTRPATTSTCCAPSWRRPARARTAARARPGRPAMTASSRGRSRTTSSPWPPSSRIAGDAALLELDPAAGQVVDDLREVRLVADERAGAGRARGPSSASASLRVEAGPQRARARPARSPSSAQASSAVSPRADLGARQAQVDRDVQAGQRAPGGARLLLAALGQRTAVVVARRGARPRRAAGARAAAPCRAGS